MVGLAGCGANIVNIDVLCRVRLFAQMLPKSFSKALLGPFWDHFWGRLGVTWVALGASLAHFLSILFAGSFSSRFGVPPPTPESGVGGLRSHLWRNGKTHILSKDSGKHWGKLYFSQMVAARAVRKGGIIKGVWLPRVALTP